MRLGTLINRIRRAINVLLDSEPCTETPNSGNLEPSVSQSPQPWNEFPTLSSQPGVQCPRCQCRIEVLIPVLLSGMPIRCQNCSLELTVNQEKSADSMTALKKLHDEFEAASDMLNKATGKN